MIDEKTPLTERASVKARVDDIGQYALLSDCRTAALVSRHATITWACLPRFDSPACFASLLGPDENGCWSVSCDDPIVRLERHYLEGTMVLETRLHIESGVLQVTDCLAIGFDNPTVVRKVEAAEGRAKFSSRVRLGFDYGSIVPLLEVQLGRRPEDGAVAD